MTQYKTLALILKASIGSYMTILFLSTRNAIHKQSEQLLQSLKQKDVAFCFACPENSDNAAFASAGAFEFLEFSENFFSRFLILKKYIKTHSVNYIHVFDEKALKLALWLKKLFPALGIAGDWHDRVLSGGDFFVTKDNPYLYAFTKGRFDRFFCSSPELCHILGKSGTVQKKVSLLPFIPFFEKNFSDLRIKSQVFSFLLHSYCENENDLVTALDAVQLLAEQQKSQKTEQKFFFFICLEKKSWVEKVLSLAEERGILDILVCAGKSFFSELYPLCDCVLCASSEGEGDYDMIYRAWHGGKVLIASDIAVHTKFVLSDSEDCALLYPRDDAASLFKCMQKILLDNHLRNQLTAGGKKKAEQNLSAVLALEYLKGLKIY